METTSQFPIIKWAQRKDCLYITIDVVHTEKPTIEIIDGKKLKYIGTSASKKYAFEIELHDEVVKEESKYTLDSRNIFLNIKKKTSGPHWPSLTTVKYKWIQVDWAYFVEEDEEEEATQPNFDGQDFGDLGGEMDEDDEPPKGECGCGHDHDHEHEHENHQEEANADKKADLSDLDKEQ
jgi:hypothetical protein